MIKKFLEFSELFEAKQVGLLYHYTSLDSLLAILDSNILKGSKPTNKNDAKLNNKPFICFTRNKNFHLESMPSVYVECRLTFDGDKLSNNYQITPYECNLIYYGDEFEERIYLNKGKLHIKDITKYLLRIDIYPNNATNRIQVENVVNRVEFLLRNKGINVGVNIDDVDIITYQSKRRANISAGDKNITYQRGGNFKVIKDNFDANINNKVKDVFISANRFNINFSIGDFSKNHIVLIFENSKIKIECVWNLNLNTIEITNQIIKKGTFDIDKFIEEIGEIVE